MSFLLWQRSGAPRIASPRLVLRAAEVPPLMQAHALREELARLQRDEQQRIACAADQATAQGHAQGVEAGRLAAREELAAGLLAMTQASEREREGLRRELAALALQVARKLLGRLADDALLAALADTAAREALPARQLVLVVHPDLGGTVHARLAALPDAPRYELRCDPSCARDTCRLETEHGSVDASLEAQLSRLAEAWSGASP